MPQNSSLPVVRCSVHCSYDPVTHRYARYLLRLIHIANPLSVYVELRDHVCPEEKRIHINKTLVNGELGINMAKDEAKTTVMKWSQYLKELDHRCVNPLWGTGRSIDYE